MIGAIGEILPLAVGIAVSPLPIIAAILVLLSPGARSKGVGFLLGWIGGLVVAVSVFQLIAALLPQGAEGESRPIVGAIKIILGTGLLLLAVQQWRSKPAVGEVGELPPWMAAIDTMSPAAVAGLAFLLAGVNPKNLILAATAGVQIAQLGAAGPQVAVTIVFVVLAATTIAGPVGAYLVAADRLAGPLGRLREWLMQYNAVIMFVLLLLLGTVTVGKGLASF